MFKIHMQMVAANPYHTLPDDSTGMLTPLQVVYFYSLFAQYLRKCPTLSDLDA